MQFTQRKLVCCPGGSDDKGASASGHEARRAGESVARARGRPRNAAWRLIAPRTIERICGTAHQQRTSSSHGPTPVADLRHVLTVPVDVLLVLDELVLELLLQVDPLVAGLRQAIDGIDHE